MPEHPDNFSPSLAAPCRAPAGMVRRLLFQRIWLPDVVYAALPWLYLLLGVCAIIAALYLEHWTWVIPYLLLIGIACVHAAGAVLALRWKKPG